ncbi:MAG TPA: primosomal protein N' [Flavipsychrobacter sp.]|nr:primosomal protein N' [Flavipsychrobacter sp.]
MLLASSNSSSSFRFADVILPLNLPQVLTYGVPHELQEALQIGMRVEVSLGRNKQYAGLVERLHNEQPESYSVKPIKGIIDKEPVVNDKQLKFWRWIAHYYLAAPGEIMQAALPAHLKLMGETTLVWKGNSLPDDPTLWSDEAYLAVEALEMKKEISISDLKVIVGQRHLSAVLNELLEREVVLINDSLEPLYKPRKEKIVVLAQEYKNESRLSGLFDRLAKSPKQLELLMAYIELSLKEKCVRQYDLLERSGGSAAQIKALSDKGIFIVEERDVDRLVFHATDEVKEVTFSPVQQKAFDLLGEKLNEKNVVLLEGVTGSGKTLLYVEKIKACVEGGKQAVLLLPEIGLTTQLVSRLYAYFGEQVGVYHSRFSNNERVEIWEKVKTHQYKIIVGPRSALWLPYDDLGLIIVDEEHDPSYKQKDPSPRFHARDASIYLASLYNARVILGSATPSVESMYNAHQGKYGYVPLNERYMGVSLPAIEVVNAKSLEKLKPQGIKLITPELLQAMTEALQEQKQIILFQNRRGYAPFQICTVCGWVPHCKNCAVSLTYHKSSDKLHCHYCGLKSAVIHTCPSCGSNRLQSKTFGTERIEEEVQQIFPEARIARMDVDSMRGKKSMSELLEQLEKHKIDILVGTQMVVKGLDFAKVTLVGILSADSLLSYPDFRVNERAFQLMEQVSGRAGRTDGAGKVIIQAFNLQHPVLQWVTEHNVSAFYTHEIKYREFFAYPPFSRLIKISFKHKEEPKAISAAAQLAQSLKTISGIAVQGPVPALVSRIRNLFIHEVWIKCPRDVKVLEQVKAFLKNQKQSITSQKGYTSLQILFDVDPT